MIEAVSRPTLDATTLPPERYSDPDLHRRELERVFGHPDCFLTGSAT